MLRRIIQIPNCPWEHHHVPCINSIWCNENSGLSNEKSLSRTSWKLRTVPINVRRSNASMSRLETSAITYQSWSWSLHMNVTSWPLGKTQYDINVSKKCCTHCVLLEPLHPMEVRLWRWELHSLFVGHIIIELTKRLPKLLNIRMERTPQSGLFPPETAHTLLNNNPIIIKSSPTDVE